MEKLPYRVAVCLALMYVCCMSGCAHKELIKKDNNLTIAPLPAVFATHLNLAYTRAFTDTVSGTFMFDYKPPVGIITIPTNMIGAEFDLYFWNRRVNNGFFFGPFVQLSKVFDNLSENVVGGTGLTPGVGFGYRWLWKSGFNIGLGGSIGYLIAIDDPNCPSGATCTSSTELDVFGNWAPRVLFDLGYAF